MPPIPLVTLTPSRSGSTAGVPADEVTPSKSFVDDLDIDSLSMVEIAVAAQDKFGVEIPDEQLKDLTTVQDVVNFVTKNAGGSA